MQKDGYGTTFTKSPLTQNRAQFFNSFTLPTPRFRILYVFLFLAHNRQRILP